MKHTVLGLVLLTCFSWGFSQNTSDEPSFYLGASFGTALAVGDFADTDITNPDAGFADNGRKIELFAGYFPNRNDRVTILATLRYQNFDTELDDLINELSEANPGATFSGSSDEWETYSLLLGISYKIGLTKKFGIFPKAALGVMTLTTPGLEVSSPDFPLAQNFSRTSETGVGLGYEFGLGLKSKLGRRLLLVPSFTFSGGFVTVRDVVTTTDDVSVTFDYEPKLFSFNLGISLAYMFY